VRGQHKRNFALVARFSAMLLIALLLPIWAVSNDEPHPLKGTIVQIVSQKSCEEKTGYTFIQNLRVHIVNQTQEKLIVERSTFSYQVYVARDLDALSKRIYEYKPNIDRAIDGRPEPANSGPDTDFAILAHDDFYDGFVDFWVSVRRADLPRQRGTLQPGSHVLQLEIATWDYQSNPEGFQKSWAPFGRLIYKPVKTEPIPLYLPSDPKLDNCR